MTGPPSDPSLPPRRPLLGLAGGVLFPHDVGTFEITDEEGLRALARLNALDGQVVAVPLREGDAAPEEPFHAVGTLARVVSRVATPSGGQRIVLQGLRRVVLEDVAWAEGCAWTSCASLASLPDDAPEAAAAERARLGTLLAALADADPAVSRELPGMIALYGEDDERITDLVASLLPLSQAERARLLAEASPLARMRTLVHDLESALVRARAHRALDGRVAERLRRRYLRAKLAELKDELSEPSTHELEIERFQERIAGSSLSSGARTAALRELDHLRRAPAASQAAARLRAYLDWMLELPWAPLETPTGGNAIDFENVEQRLSDSHTGLVDVKRRIAEFLAVRQLGGSARGTVLCFLGPPGTGKSSMGRAVANLLGRPLLSIPIGAITHEKEFVGLPHERASGTPGLILAGLHRLGRSDPVILLDEIDKVSLGGAGNSAGALLSLLDPEQNCEFLDQYLGVPFDLSNCLFLATATDAAPIPEALLDRMETIEFAGYSEREKYEIARTHLLGRAREYAGLKARQLNVTAGALRALIRGYTEEAGVRQLQRHLISLARKAAVEVVRGGKPLRVRKTDLALHLGPRTVEEDLRLRRPAVGVTTGLAWTSAGGSLLPVEAISMPGAGRLILTGSLGDVLRESVQTAVSYVRTFCSHLGLDSDVLDNIDLHLHLPSAATPKDGPSAGVAIAVALVSLLTRGAARHDVAMTGELSLLGQVLAVGGIREKLLAAIRAGVPEVILPRRNAEDCMRLDPEIRRRVRIHLIDDVREAFELAIRRGRSRASHSIEISVEPTRRGASGRG